MASVSPRIGGGPVPPPTASEDAAAFIADRIANPPKKRSRRQASCTCSFETRQALVSARKTEWVKRTGLNAARFVIGAMLQELLEEGHETLQLPRIVVNRNEHSRCPKGPEAPEDQKSRLVVWGDLEDATGVRTDSPTCGLEAQHMSLNWVPCEGLRLKAGDASYRALPDEEIALGTMPIYCKGRRAWRSGEASL